MTFKKIDDVPYEQQFNYLLNMRQANEIEEQILEIDFTEENLDQLKMLFNKWHQKTGAI